MALNKFTEILEERIIRCQMDVTFLGAFGELRKATISSRLSVHPSVRMEQLGSHGGFL